MAEPAHNAPTFGNEVWWSSPYPTPKQPADPMHAGRSPAPPNSGRQCILRAEGPPPPRRTARTQRTAGNGVVQPFGADLPNEDLASGVPIKRFGALEPNAIEGWYFSATKSEYSSRIAS